MQPGSKSGIRVGGAASGEAGTAPCRGAELGLGFLSSPQTVLMPLYRPVKVRDLKARSWWEYGEEETSILQGQPPDQLLKEEKRASENMRVQTWGPLDLTCSDIPGTQCAPVAPGSQEWTSPSTLVEAPLGPGTRWCPSLDPPRVRWRNVTCRNGAILRSSRVRAAP